jgi:hypothetical protein
MQKLRESMNPYVRLEMDDQFQKLFIENWLSTKGSTAI